MARGGSSLKGAVISGDGFTSGSVGMPQAFGHGQEPGGWGRSGARGVLAKEEERGKRKGWAASVTPFISTAGGRGRRGGSGVESTWKRETGGEREALAWQSTAGNDSWLTGAGGRRA
jgi:hypothetical protein